MLSTAPPGHARCVYTALVLVEELLKAGHPTVVVDPVGVCWGLRAAANGTDPGLPIIVMGGDRTATEVLSVLSGAHLFLALFGEPRARLDKRAER